MEASALPRGVELHFHLPRAFMRLRSDEQLVVLFRDGSEAAFAELHDRYRPRLHAYARHMLRARAAADVEDVIQDVFERAQLALRYAGAPPQVVRIWLYSVARNRCIDELRRRAPSQADIHASSRPPARDTVTVAERRADVARLVADLHLLPEQQRSALLLRELAGLSHTELAATLGVSVSAVKSLLVRARTGLVEAQAARETTCDTIRLEIAAINERGVKLTGRTRRHLRECRSCSAYRAELRDVGTRLRGLAPAPPLLGSLLGRLIVRGGSAGGATSTGIGAGSLAAGGVCKLAALVCATAAVTAGGVLDRSTIPWLSSSGSGAVGRVAAQTRHASAGTRPATLAEARVDGAPGRVAPGATVGMSGPAAVAQPGAGTADRVAPRAEATSPAVGGAPLPTGVRVPGPQPSGEQRPVDVSAATAPVSDVGRSTGVGPGTPAQAQQTAAGATGTAAGTADAAGRQATSSGATASSTGAELQRQAGAVTSRTPLPWPLMRRTGRATKPS